MAYVPFSIPLTGGLDRSITPTKANPSSFYTMSNVRQSNVFRGMVEQTPRWSLTATRAQGTFWNSAISAAEPTTSAIVGLTRHLLTQYCAFDTVQLKGICQTAVPTYTGVLDNTKGCLLKFNNTAPTVTLGGAYDVVIDGTNTFKWRVNAGAYTSGVVINLASGNAIDSGAVQLYWLAATGFTVNDTWSWTRTDSSASMTNILPYCVPQVFTATRTFYPDAAGRLMTIEFDAAGLNSYVRSVGYRPVYGQSVAIYDDHLFVFGSNATGTLGAGSYILNSDLSNYDSFIATDVNEADDTGLELNSVTSGAVLYALSGFVMQGRLFVVTTSGLYYSDYTGLPVPFAFKKLYPCRFDNNTQSCMSVLTTKAAYIFRNDAVYRFDGANLTQLIDLTTLGYTPPLHIAWNDLYDEVYIVFQTVMLVYQETYGTFYTRAVDVGTAGCTGLGSTGALTIGTSSRKYYFEDSTFAFQPAFDSVGGTAYVTPTLITQLLGGTAYPVKEAQTVYLAADPTVAASTFYSVDTALKLVLSWYISNSGKITGAPATAAWATWSTASTDGQISAPRASYRYIAYQLEWTGTTSNHPPSQCTLQALETLMYQPAESTKR